jgi:glutamyl-tRNA reductase
MTRRPERPLLVVDIGAPHDVDPQARLIGGVGVLELADLRTVVDDNIGGRKAAVPAVEEIVDTLTREFVRWYQSRAAVPLIARLRTRAERIRTNEIEKLFASRPELDEAQRTAIVQASIGIINKLLHEPLTKLRETAASATEAGDSADALNKLVDLASMEEQIERQFSTTFSPPAR